MVCGSLTRTTILFLVFALCGVIADYGFVFPRVTDKLWLGQEITLRWDSKDDYISLILFFDEWSFRRLDSKPIIIATNITNTRSYRWTIPTNISEDILKSSAYFSLENGLTEAQSFITEQLYILPNQSSSPPPKVESKLGRFTTPVLTRGRNSIKENTAFNITWDSPAEYVKLSVGLPGAAFREPFSLFEMRKNTGFYYWDKMTDNGWGQTPQFFRLQSNDTEFANITLDSETFYVEPHGYPTTTINSFVTPARRLVFPLKDDLEGIYTFDTYVFEWWPPVAKGTNLIVLAVCETYQLQTTSLFAGRTSFSTNNLTWQIPFDGGEMMMKTLNNCPIHFNIVQINPISGKWDWSATKLVARSDQFPFKGTARVGVPRTIPDEKLKERLAQLPHSQSTGLSTINKMIIGILPVMSLGFLVGGLLWFWWIPRKRKKLDEERARANMPAELNGDKTMDFHEIGGAAKPVEVDHDTFLRELADSKPAAEELEAIEVQVAELEGEPLSPLWKDIEAVPKGTDSKSYG